jgi:hypothetical protein
MNRTKLLFIIGAVTLGLAGCKKPAEQSAPANDTANSPASANGTMPVTSAAGNDVSMADPANAAANTMGNSAAITGEDNGQGGGTTRGPGQ